MAFRFKATTYFLLITTMIVPVQIILIPMLPWFRTLGLNSGPQEYLGIALVHTAFGAGWAIFMLGAFFAQIPEELLEAARMDGAGWFDVFRRITLPLAVPGIVSFAIIDFVFVWNDLLLASPCSTGSTSHSRSAWPTSRPRTSPRRTWSRPARSWRSCRRSCCSPP
jgi:ABC-type glycerol-3-phosphate transport system permease component